MSLHVVVEADGGSRGNPGPAGYGAVVLEEDSGRVLVERKGALGTATNNVAEYTGLVEGLRAAAQLDATTVDVRLDSKLVVEQMCGRWQVKNAALRPLAAQATEIAAEFQRVSYTWIPRARNVRADALANEAMDEHEDGEADDDVDGTEREDVSAASVRHAPSPVPAWTGSRGAPTRIFLLRHGQTALSIDRRYSGRGDAELTEHGSAQAGALAKRLSGLLGAAYADSSGRTGELTILTSPLRRAMATAEAVTSLIGGEARTHEGLIETDFGSWEGLTFAEAAEQDPQLHRAWLGDASVSPPSGESFADVHRRVSGVLDELLAIYRGHDIAIVSHVTPIKSLLRIALDAGPQLLYRLHLDLASLSSVEFYPDGNASVRLVNDTSHLD